MPDEKNEKSKGLLSLSPSAAWSRFRARFLEQMPKKRFINLAAVNVRRINWFATIPAILLTLAAAAVISKFAVVDRIEVANQERRELNTLEETLAGYTRRLADYAEVQEQYAHYTFSGQTEEETNRAGRPEVMQMIRRVVLPGFGLDRWTLQGNTLQLWVRGETLQAVNLLAQQLLAEEMVDFCTVATAETGDSRRTARLDADDLYAGEVSALVTVVVKRIADGEEQQP